LLSILAKVIKDDDALRLLREIIDSFRTSGYPDNEPKGIPIGNLTSQVFANIYMNDFDQFMKQQLRVKQYIRYTDDFVIVDSDKAKLEKLLPLMNDFLDGQLRLSLHPRKIILRKLSQGIDFLGYVILPHHRTLRTRTKRRMFRKLQLRVKDYKTNTGSESSVESSLKSYLGVLSHANAHHLSEQLQNQYWFWMNE